MEFRKLIEFGKGSFVVSVPKDWVTKNRLKKGHTLNVEKREHSIVISSELGEKDIEKRTISISIDNKTSKEIKTEIITAYLTNYDIIEIISKDMNKKDESVKEIIKNLAGLLILEQTNTKITAKYVMDIKEISLDSILRRMDTIARTFIIDAMSCLKGKKTYESMRRRDADINRLNFLVVRTVRYAFKISRSLLEAESFWELYTFMRVSRKIEKVADLQKRIARNLEQLKLSKKFSSDLEKIYQDIHQSFLDVMKAFYKKDKKAALLVENSTQERVMRCKELLDRDKKEYSLLKKHKQAETQSHMRVNEIIHYLKTMAIDIKMIARCTLNN